MVPRTLGPIGVAAMEKRGINPETAVRFNIYTGSKNAAGEVLWWKFEGIKLRLADNTFYTGDFAVQAADEVVEIHEVKGFWQDDARVKIKVAASLYPFRFFAVKPIAKKDGGGWKREEF